MKVNQYFRECSQELKKVTWPKKKEVATSVRVVLVSTVITSLVLGAVDFLLLHGITLLF